MFETLDMAPPDAILGLGEAFKKDPHPHKINLSVGVYKDASGKTPVLACVKEAERRLLAGETSKGYLAIDGLPEYDRMVQQLLFAPAIGERARDSRQRSGGHGAIAGGHRRAAGRGRPPTEKIPSRSGLVQQADLGQPPEHLFRGRAANRHLSVHRRGRAGARLCRDARRAQGDSRGRRRAAARLLPEPDRHRPDAGAVEANRRRR